MACLLRCVQWLGEGPAGRTLRHLSLSRLMALGDGALRPLSSMRSLRFLDLSHCRCGRPGDGVRVMACRPG